MKVLFQKTWKITVLNVILFIVIINSSIAQSYSPLVYDKHVSSSVGAYNLGLLHQGLYSLEDKFIPDSIGRVTSGESILYRAAKLVLLDIPIDHLIALSQHEVFGHGARLREFGYRNISYELNLSPPFGSGSGLTFYPQFSASQNEERLATIIGGVEANRVLANHLTNQILLDDALHYRRGLFYLIAQNDLLIYLLGTRYNSSVEHMNGNDMTAYINELNSMYPSNNTYNIEQLSNKSLISLLNPIQWYSAASVFYTYLIKGQKQLKMPMFKFGSVRYLPALNYSLTPFGSQYHFLNYIRYDKMLFSADFQLGDNTFNTFYGLSMKGFNLVDNPILGLNAHLDAWSQPELELVNYTMPSSMKKMGGAFKVDLMLRPVNQKNKLGIFVQTGYKTKGYTMGESLTESFILRYGLSLHL